MNKIIKKLKGGDLRSIGNANEVVKDILNKTILFKEVFEGMMDDDPIIRMRSADVIEKVSSKHPEYLQPFKSRLVNKVSKIDQQEVQWHVAQIFSYISISKKERDKIIKILLSYIKTTDSNIVKVFCMQTLAKFASKDEQIKPKIIKKIKEMIKFGSPAIQSRGKKLLNKLM